MSRICLSLICLLLASTRTSSAADPAFPNIKSLTKNGFMSKVEISGRPENYTVFVEEIYDSANGVTKINLLKGGHKQTIVIHSRTKQVASIENSACEVKSPGEANSLINPVFPTWLDYSPNDNEFYYGPTSILRRASEAPPKYNGKATVRGMDCHSFTGTDPDRQDEVNIDYFFTADWTTFVNVSKSELLPVQVRLYGEGILIDGAPYENFIQYIDYVYFIPAVKDPRLLELPSGIGCKGLKSSKAEMPPLPKRFTVAGEHFYTSDPSSIQSVNTFRVWYDYAAKLARLDIYTKDDNGISKVLDYNTGLMYVTTNNEECTASPISESYFDKTTGDLKLVLKDPESTMGLKGDYYYLGKKFSRGIYCDVWESVVENYTVEELVLNRIVYTYFLSSSYWEIDVEGEIEEQIPIRVEVNTYLEATGSAATTAVFNLFHFRKHPPLVYTPFSIEYCASATPDKKYIMILINTDVDDAKKAEGVDAAFRIVVQNKILDIAGISPLRLPFIKVYYEPNDISIVALMLERAPAIVQFVKLDEDVPKSKELNKGIVKNEEICAEECIKLDVCIGFHFCKGKGECYVSITDWTDDWGEDVKGPKSCVLYERHTAGSNTKDVLLKDAIDNLEKAISDKKFTISVRVQKDDITFTASEFESDFSPVATGDRDLFSRVIGQKKFKTTQTTRRGGTTHSASECYRKCQKEENIACSSFSFCVDNNECLLSSVLVLPKKDIDYELESNQMCAVYSIQYLQMFEEYQGQVRISPGKDAITVGSASECAKSCREREKPMCRGFDFCNDKNQCVLHEKHVLDIKEGDLTRVGSGCSHYALKYIADYMEEARIVLKDPKSKTTVGVSAEKCAQMCSENIEVTCKSFDFCPNDLPTKTSCTLNTLTLNDADSEDSDTCQHYAKKDGIVEDFLTLKKEKQAEDSSSGYTPGGLAAVIIGVLISGIAVGIIGFLIYSYLRKSRLTDERSVRFMKQENA